MPCSKMKMPDDVRHFFIHRFYVSGKQVLIIAQSLFQHHPYAITLIGNLVMLETIIVQETAP